MNAKNEILLLKNNYFCFFTRSFALKTQKRARRGKKYGEKNKPAKFPRSPRLTFFSENDILYKISRLENQGIEKETV